MSLGEEMLASTSEAKVWQTADVCPSCSNPFQPVDFTSEIQPHCPRVLPCGHALCDACVRANTKVVDNTMITMDRSSSERTARGRFTFTLRCPTCNERTRTKSRRTLDNLPIKFARSTTISALEPRQQLPTLACDVCHRIVEMKKIRVCLSCERAKQLDSIVCTACTAEWHIGHEFTTFEELVKNESIREKLLNELRNHELSSSRRSFTVSGTDFEPIRARSPSFSVSGTRFEPIRARRSLTQLLYNSLVELHEQSVRKFSAELASSASSAASGDFPLEEYCQKFSALFHEMAAHNRAMSGVLGVSQLGDTINIDQMLLALFRL